MTTYTPPPGNEVALPLACPYTPPAGNNVALPMPDGFGLISGTARFGEGVPAALVVALGLDGIEQDRAIPTQGATGAYTLVTEGGPLFLIAYAFNPEAWRGIWSADEAYTLGEVVFSNGNTTEESLAMICVEPGTSSSVEPDWQPGTGDITLDNGTEWQTLGRVRDLAPVVNFAVI